ncbi:hypothetical protein D3C87_1821760 [compost metagenome]
MRVWHHAQNIASRLLVELLVGGHAAGHIVAERDKIDGGFQRFAIGIGDFKRNSVIAEESQHIARIRPTTLYVAEELPRAVFL